jgi:hypothetical protein
MIEWLLLLLATLWHGVLVILAFVGWVIGKVVGTFAAGMWSGIKGSF